MKRIIDELLTYDRLLKPYPLYGAARKYAVFLTGGTMGFVLALLTTTFFTEFLGVWYALSYVFGLFVAIIFTFVYHTHITFNNKSHWRRRFVKFIMTVIAISVLNWFMVIFATETLGMVYVLSIFLVTLILSILNFGINRIWIFRN